MNELLQSIIAATAPHLRHSIISDKRIVLFDLETTSPDTKAARIVQFGAVVLEPDDKIRTIEHLIFPGIPIPPEATEVHGISDEMVADCPIFVRYSQEI